ncbi:MAG: hypothetical protein BIFFINMI_03077 [Phycisphaerae bacterium]|nr:hypothetical protein [Phycisphaerae bacterium]
MEEKSELLYRDEVYRIIGAAIKVHKTLGAGFLESVYAEALAYELTRAGVAFEAEKGLPIRYKDFFLEKRFVADFVCESKIILELKAAEALCKAHEAQLLNYLRATGIRVGLLINFASPARLEWKRMIV